MISNMTEVIEPPNIKRLTSARRITAERMTLSASTIPQVTYTMRCDVTELMDFRRLLKPEAVKRGIALPLDVFFVRAVALATAAFPEVNARWVEGQGIEILPQVSVGVAVDAEKRGLLVPVLRDVGSQDLWSIAAELDQLVKGTRSGKLGPDTYTGATFTISSLASFGVEVFNPILNPPETAALGIGAIVPTPVYHQDILVKRRMLSLSLTTDHRILDGAPSARFLSRVRDLIEQPSGLL
jgi:pyruvate dehydrogenase E2 component (dihydrolipoamide acetyltransferase)